MPVTFQPRRKPDSVTARMTAFSPGASPPPVLTRMCIAACAISWLGGFGNSVRSAPGPRRVGVDNPETRRREAGSTSGRQDVATLGRLSGPSRKLDDGEEGALACPVGGRFVEQAAARGARELAREMRVESPRAPR